MTGFSRSEYDQPLIAIDVVPMSFSKDTGVRVGTAIRAFEPFVGREALPGVLLGAGESLEEGAYRALLAKSRIEVGKVRHLRQIAAFDGPDRDPRAHAISIAFLAIVEPAAGEPVTHWAAFDGVSFGLPFDHDSIIAAAIDTALTRLWSDTQLTKALTGESFATNVGAQLDGILNGRKPHAGNFNRDLSNLSGLRKLENRLTSGRGRPATIWEWV